MMPKTPVVNEPSERPRCPACRVELRIRDDKGAAPVFPCPECHTPLRLERRPNAPLTIVLAETPARTTTRPRGKVPSKTPEERSPENARPDRTLLWFGLGMAAITAIVIGTLMREKTPEPQNTEPVAVDPVIPETVAPETPHEEPVANPFTELNGRIRTATTEGNRFPSMIDHQSPLLATQQFSWLARLEARSATLAPERRPVFDVPWSDPANEPFVGRRVVTYLNPQVTKAVGEDGRPATHFVGVAGVGRDAVDLPMGHSRAGMFGAQRAVTAHDLRDGQANTLMVLGVDAQLGSWADPGRATVRALTQPPYLHGPDGFGGGPDQPLPGLMADGSVRLFAADTDPLLLRRLAAINDGLPLDLSVPGEPGDAPSVAPPASFSIAMEDPENPPVSALAAIAESQRPVITRPAAGPLLATRLVSFQQTKPTTRRQLLLIAEDLLGRPVVFDQENLGAFAAQLDAKVTFSLEDTTVAAVLEQVLSGSDLEIVIGPDRATVHRKAAGTNAAVRVEP